MNGGKEWQEAKKETKRVRALVLRREDEMRMKVFVVCEKLVSLALGAAVLILAVTKCSWPHVAAEPARRQQLPHSKQQPLSP